jgi:phage protein D
VTSQQIMQNIVANHPQVSLDLSQAGAGVGTPYDQLTGRLFLHRSEWDVMTGLADHEGWRIRMDGRTVVVEPKPSPDTAQSYAVYYTPPTSGQGVTSNCMSLRLTHSKNIASGVDVIVEAHDAKSGTQVRARSRSSRSAFNTAGRTTYTFNFPGMTQDQAQQAADARAGQISLFEYALDFMMPGDPTLTVDQMIALSGTGTAFDQSYYIAQIAHVLDMTLGYEMTVTGQNTPPGTSTDNSVIPATAAPAAPEVQDFTG